jgi:hypothetical protein
MSFAVVDTVLTGHASAVDLATLRLGLSVYSWCGCCATGS